MATRQLTEADIRNELRKLVQSARKKFREDMDDNVALIEAQASIYSDEEKARAPKVIASIKIKAEAADAIYDQLFHFLDHSR